VVGHVGETEAPQRLDVGTIHGRTRGRGKLLGEPFGSLRACTWTIEPVARRQHRAEQQRLGEIEPGTEVRSNADLLGERRRQRVVDVDRGARLGHGESHGLRLRWADVTRPEAHDPAGLQLQQGEVRALEEELPDDAEPGQVRVQGSSLSW